MQADTPETREWPAWQEHHPPRQDGHDRKAASRHEPGATGGSAAK
ncbi:unnamed protein product [Acidocella sp. C78]|nr:unnamed protein product [Acidocella sp. C78]